MDRREGVLLSSVSLFVAVLAVVYVFSDLRYGTAREGGEDMSLVFEVRERIHSDYVDQVDSLRVIDAGIDGMLDVLSEDDALSLEQDWEADRPGDRAQRQRLIRRSNCWNHLWGNRLARFSRARFDMGYARRARPSLQLFGTVRLRRYGRAFSR